MMKHLAALVVGAGILVALCNGACNYKLPDPEINGCSYNGVEHKRGSTWRTEDCVTCSCHMDGGMGCCTANKQPVDYDEDKCKFVFNKETCNYDLVPNDDPTIVCQGYSMIG